MDFSLLYYEAHREERSSYGLQVRFLYPPSLRAYYYDRRAPLRRHTRRHVEFPIGAFEHC